MTQKHKHIDHLPSSVITVSIMSESVSADQGLASTSEVPPQGNNKLSGKNSNKVAVGQSIDSSSSSKGRATDPENPEKENPESGLASLDSRSARQSRGRHTISEFIFQNVVGLSEEYSFTDVGNLDPVVFAFASCYSFCCGSCACCCFGP